MKMRKTSLFTSLLILTMLSSIMFVNISFTSEGPKAEFVPNEVIVGFNSLAVASVNNQVKNLKLLKVY